MYPSDTLHLNYFPNRPNRNTFPLVLRKIHAYRITSSKKQKLLFEDRPTGDICFGCTPASNLPTFPQLHLSSSPSSSDSISTVVTPKNPILLKDLIPLLVHVSSPSLIIRIIILNSNLTFNSFHSFIRPPFNTLKAKRNCGDIQVVRCCNRAVATLDSLPWRCTWIDQPFLEGSNLRDGFISSLMEDNTEEYSTSYTAVSRVTLREDSISSSCSKCDSKYLKQQQQHQTENGNSNDNNIGTKKNEGTDSGDDKDPPVLPTLCCHTFGAISHIFRSRSVVDIHHAPFLFLGEERADECPRELDDS